MATKKTHDQLKERVRYLEKKINRFEQTEMSALKVKDHLAKVQKFAHLGSWEFDMATEKTTWSDEMYRIFNLDPDILEITFDEWLNTCIHPEDMERVSEAGNQAINRHIPQSLEYRIMHRDGSIRTVFGDTHMVYDDTGKPVKLFGTVQDITKHRDAEKALDESEERFKTIFDNANDQILYVDVDGTILNVNERVEDIFGYKPQEVIGHKFEEFKFISKEDMEKAAENYKNKAAGKPGKIQQYKGYRKDGAVIFVEVNSRLIKKEGKITAVLHIIRDITKRKLAEDRKNQLEIQLQQSQKMEALGTLAGGIAHDFNNILGMILLNTEMAFDDAPNRSNMKRSLKQVLNGVVRAKELVDHILTFSRRVDIKQKPIQINTVVKDTLQMLKSIIPSTVIISRNISADSGIIMADSTQVQQLVLNLCTNAAHAIKEKGGKLELEVKNVTINKKLRVSNLAPGPYVKLTVKDNGHGIAPENIDRIFEPFFTTKQPGEGTGLGLSIVHGIVASNQGVITVDSDLGKGATFNVFFPKKDNTDLPSKNREQSIPKGDEKILFVDDEKDLVYAAQRTIERLGYEVVVATNGAKALELFSARPGYFDIVITDVTMPLMTGMELSKELLNIRPDIPVVICTGYSDMLTQEKVREIGARYCIMKPFSKRKIAETIRKALDSG